MYSIIQTHIFRYLLTRQVSKGKLKKELQCPLSKKKLEQEIQHNFLLWLNSNKKDSLKLIEVLIERSLLRTDLTKIKELERKTIKEKIGFQENLLIAQVDKSKEQKFLLLKAIVLEVQPNKQD